MIDRDFAAVVDLTDYHIFLTPYGRDVLFVTAQTPEWFSIVRCDRGRQCHSATTNRPGRQP
jgi:hypothetical protein